MLIQLTKRLYWHNISIRKFMKKQILFIALLLAGFCTVAQVNLTNVTLQYFGSDNTTPLDGILTVENNNAAAVDINVIRTIEILAHSQSLNTDHIESFCFGQYCYLPNTDTSLYVTPIAGNSSEGTFVAHIDPAGFDGMDRIHYLFYDVNNPSDSASVTLEFTFGATAVDENKNLAYLKFNNEVNNFAVLNYHLPSVSRNSRIDIYNMLGSKLRSIPLNDQQGTKVVSTADLSNGVYLLSLITNNNVSKTYKMIVAHNKAN